MPMTTGGCTHLAMMAVFLDTDEGISGIAISGPGAEKTIAGMVDGLIVATIHSGCTSAVETDG